MTYPDITTYNINTTGLDGVLCYTRDISPAFFPMLTFAFFLVLCIGSYLAQKRTIGRANIIGSIAVSSFLTFMLNLFFTLDDCLSNVYMLGTWGAITIVSVILLFVQKESY